MKDAFFRRASGTSVPSSGRKNASIKNQLLVRKLLFTGSLVCSSLAVDITETQNVNLYRFLKICTDSVSSSVLRGPFDP